jgi:hypothetical protein
MSASSTRSSEDYFLGGPFDKALLCFDDVCEAEVLRFCNMLQRGMQISIHFVVNIFFSHCNVWASFLRSNYRKTVLVALGYGRLDSVTRGLDPFCPLSVSQAHAHNLSPVDVREP